MATNTTWDKIKSAMKRLESTHKRQDEDRDFAYMKDFYLTGHDESGKRFKLDGVNNVTGNQPVTFADAIVTDLMSAQWQCKVEGDVSQPQAREIEKFVESGFDQGNEYLKTEHRMSGGLDAWLSNHVCLRPHIGVRICSGFGDGGLYYIELLPLDMRWCAYPLIGNKWIAPFYFLSGEDIKELYPDREEVMMLENSKMYIIVDYWDSVKEEIWYVQADSHTYELDGTYLLSRPNEYGYPPFVLTFPSVGFMLRDKDYLEHESESVFWKDRKLYPELNRQLSIQQTLGMNILTPGYEREAEEFDNSPAIPVPRAGEVQKVPKGQAAKPVPTGDFNRASLSTKEDIVSMIEQGGISNAELGQSGLDRPGVWFARQFEIRHKLEKPRFDAIADMKAGIARMMIKQAIASSKDGNKIRIGKTGRKYDFDVSKLLDPDKYSITFEYMTTSKEMEIINLAEANAAWGRVPRFYIFRDILKSADPAGWMREIDMEMAREVNPAITIMEMAHSYLKEAELSPDPKDKAMKNWMSMMLTHQYVMQMKMQLQPPMPQEEEGQKKSSPPQKNNADLTGLASMGKLLGAGGMIERGGQLNNATMRSQEVGNEATKMV